MEYLIAHRDRAVHRDELVEAIFHRPDVSDAQLGQVVLRTRRSLGDDGNRQHMIRTIAGYGYRWIAPMDDESGPGMSADSASFAPVAADDVRIASAAHSSRTEVASKATLRLAFVPIAVALAIMAATYGWTHRASTPPASVDSVPARAERVVVLPIRVDGSREDGWVRLGAMDLIAERLREAGLGVPPSENVLGVLQSARAPGQPDVAGVRDATGAQLVVQGDAVRVAGGWTIRLVAFPAHGIGVPVEFSASDAIDTARGATDRLLAALGHSTPTAQEHGGQLDETLQRARAALLANELETARSILAASPALGARPDLMAYWLAQVDFRAGRLDVADAALTGLLARNEPSADPHFLAQVLSARGATRMRRGDFARGGSDFDAALTALDGRADPLERGRARLRAREQSRRRPSLRRGAGGFRRRAHRSRKQR